MLGASAARLTPSSAAHQSVLADTGTFAVTFLPGGVGAGRVASCGIIHDLPNRRAPLIWPRCAICCTRRLVSPQAFATSDTVRIT
jgi:hypothetical protein